MRTKINCNIKNIVFFFLRETYEVSWTDFTICCYFYRYIKQIRKKKKKAMKLLAESLRMQVPQESKEPSVMHN